MIESLEKWIEEADAYMLKNYLITLTEDAGVERAQLEQAQSDGMAPEEFCTWLATKYDLDSVKDMRLNWML